MGKFTMTSEEHAPAEVSCGPRHNWRPVRGGGAARTHRGALYKHLQVGKGTDLLPSHRRHIQEGRVQPNIRKQFPTELSNNTVGGRVKW